MKTGDFWKSEGVEMIKLTKPESDFDVYKKNFPMMKDDEIKKILSEEIEASSKESSEQKCSPNTVKQELDRIQIVNRSINQLKMKHYVKPYFDTKQKELDQKL